MKKLLLSLLAVLLASSFIPSRVAAEGEDNPTGVSGIYSGNVVSGGSYDPYTGNMTREVDDIVVPSSVGKYPLKWTRYWNSRGAEAGWGGAWNFSYGYSLDGWALIAGFPDGRRINCSDQCPSGVEEQVGNPLILADGGKVVFEWHQDPVSYKDVNGHIQWTVSTYYLMTQLVDPYGQITSVSYDIYGYDKDGNAIRRRARITEPGGRYLQLVYDVNNTMTGVQAWDGRGNMIQSVTYTYTAINNAGTDFEITRADYSDGTFASYTYEMDGGTSPNNHPRLITCDDVRYSGPMRQRHILTSKAKRTSSQATSSAPEQFSRTISIRKQEAMVRPGSLSMAAALVMTRAS